MDLDNLVKIDGLVQSAGACGGSRLFFWSLYFSTVECESKQRGYKRMDLTIPLFVSCHYHDLRQHQVSDAASDFQQEIFVNHPEFPFPQLPFQ